MTTTYTDAGEVSTITSALNGVAQAVMTPVPAAFFESCNTGRQIQFVMGHQYTLRRNLIKLAKCAYGFAAEIHKSAGY